MYGKTKQVYDVLAPRQYYNSEEEPASFDEDPALLYKQLRLTGNGGSSYPDGEWEWSGSYNIDVSPGDMGNLYAYHGSLFPYYPEPRDKTSKRYGGRRKRRGWLVSFAVHFDRYAGNVSIRLIDGDIISGIKKARIACIKAIQEFEAGDRFKTEMWPQIIAPDRRVPVIKEIDGELWWVATAWKGFHDAVIGRQGFYSGEERPMGDGTFYTKEIRYDRVYDKGEDGRTDYNTGRNVYKDTIYPSLEFSAYGYGGKTNKDPDIGDKIETVLWEPGASNLADYNMIVKYDKFPGIKKW